MLSQYELYKKLHFIRLFEEKVAEIYPADKIKSPIHLSIGQEFISVAVCQFLNQQDYVAATYRGHAAYLPKGGDPKTLIAEMFGKESGCARGRGGSMHLISPEANVIGTSAIVGTGVPVATGYALSQKLNGTDDIVVCFLGDGATEEGCFYESLNFAGLKKLPILFVVENNKYAIHEPLSKRWADSSLAERVKGFGLQIYKHEQSDVHTLSELSGEIIQKVRAGEGPAILEVDCYRWYQHVGPNKDFDQGYRNEAESVYWIDNDPVKIIAQKLGCDEIMEIHQLNESRVKESFEFAEKSNFPNESELKNYVYK